MNTDTYLLKYLDRRMNLIIEDWNLATRDDLNDLESRYSNLQEQLSESKKFEKETQSRISDLEDRVKRMRSRI